jgi:hypothetical protein
MSGLHERFPVYSKILGLYPKPYHRKYETEMLQTTADMLDDAPGLSAKLAIWGKIAVDLPVNITKQQLQYIGGIMQHETPQYIKRNSLIANTLLLPFFAALIANSLDKVINNHTLINSWLWKGPAIELWVLYLPEAALLLALASYIAYLRKGVGNKKSSVLTRVIDVKHLWPVVVPAAVAFGILCILAFHDSVQCWLQSPTHLAGHISQAWQCTVHNQSLQVFRRLL